MASSAKRSWKLQDFTAHTSNVTCLALGHKSGRVLVTGGDDRKVNLWAVGKPNCIMSLSGHATPVETVRFNQTEELVCAGSQTGALKIWDLEAAKLNRTLTGHKSGIKCTDFHPYGDFLASGSHDTTLKLWDTRRKGCIFTYKGHSQTVNSLKFSPDGQWIASGGDDGVLKVWDLRIGRVLKQFEDHTNSIMSVEFHPHEFLLASGGLDRTVNFWDLESFQLVSTERDAGSVRALVFSQGGECIYGAATDGLRVHAWEPARTLDTLPISWGKIQDVAIAQSQLVGVSCQMANVTLYIVEINKLRPFGGLPLNTEVTSSPFSYNQNVRRSFTKPKDIGLSPKVKPNVKTIEESTSGTDPDEESMADIQNVNDYREVFKPNRSLTRTPPPEPFLNPQESIQTDPTKPQIILPVSQSEPEYLSLSSLEIQTPHQPNSLELRTNTSPPQSLTTSTSYNRSQSNLENVFKSRLKKSVPEIITIPDSPDPTPPPRSIPNSPPQRHNYIRRQNSCKDVPQNNNNNEKNFPVNSNLKHSVSEVSINRTIQSRSNSFSKGLNNTLTSRKEIQSRLTNNRNSMVSRIPNPTTSRPSEKPVAIRPVTMPNANMPVDIYVTPRNLEQKKTDDDFVPMSMDKPVGLDLDDFLPKSNRLLGSNQSMSNMSEAEVLGSIMRGHEPMMTVLSARNRSLQVVYSLWHNKGVRAALEGAIAMNDLAIIVDILSIMVLKTSLWNLDICVLMLPKIHDLLQSKFETYMTTGCTALRLILHSFSPVIKSNVQAPCGSFGVDIPREERYKKCKQCHEHLMNIRSFLLKRQTVQGALGSTFRDLTKLMETLD